MRTGDSQELITLRRRIASVLPGWSDWPRRLRRIYVLLETFGSSDASVEEMCDEFGWDVAGTFQMIGEIKSFSRTLVEYRLEEGYPKAKKWKKPLQASELHALYAYESAMVQFMHHEDRRGQGTFGVKLMDQMGLLKSLEERDGPSFGGNNVPASVASVASLPDWSDLNEPPEEK